MTRNHRQSKISSALIGHLEICADRTIKWALWRAAAFVLILAVVAASSGCKQSLPEFVPMEYASPKPGDLWKPRLDARPEAFAWEKLPGIPPELQASADRLTLVQLVDVALRINPSTRQAWEQARAAAAEWAASRGEYYPTISGDLGGSGGKLPQTSGLSSGLQPA